MRLETITWTQATGWSTALPEPDQDRDDGPPDHGGRRSGDLAVRHGDTLVIVFGDAALETTRAPLQELADAYDGAIVVGCSSAGEIAGPAVHDGSLSVAVASFESTRLELVTSCVDDVEASHAIGRRLAGTLSALDRDADLRAVFVLSDGLVVNGGSLVAGMTSALGPEVVLTGGLAGDDARFGSTWIMVAGEPRSAHVSAVGLYGPDLRVGHGSRGGWDPFGPERLVTRSDGNTLYELDGQPALELYKKYLGDRAAGLPGTALLFPLAVRMPGAVGRTVTRTILGVDESDHSMRFAGDVPQGARVQLMRANFDRLVESAQDAAEDAVPSLPDAPGADGEDVLALAISCVGRRLLLGERIEDELEATEAGLPASARIVGFYSYGEISPITAGTCDLHNQTMTITTYSERLAMKVA